MKPDFWTSDQVLECSRDARLLFIGLWNFCDDEGRHPYRPREIKARVFPADDLTQENVLELLRELEGNGLIAPYSVEGQDYLHITGWHRHQRIDKPQPARYPAPFQEHSGNDPGTLPPDRKGYEGIGKDKGEKSEIDFSCLPIQDRSLVDDYIAHRKKQKLQITQNVINRLAKQLRLCADDGIDPDDALGELLDAGWRSLKPEWVKKRLSQAGGKDEFDAGSYDL